MEPERFHNQDERYGPIGIMLSLGSYREYDPTHRFEVYQRGGQSVVVDVTEGMIVATERPTF